MKIKRISLGESASGNAGCNNGNYDIPVVVEFDNGERVEDHTCGCCCGCNDTFPYRGLISSLKNKGFLQAPDAEFPYGLYTGCGDPWFEEAIFPSGALDFRDLEDFYEFLWPDDEE